MLCECHTPPNRQQKPAVPTWFATLSPQLNHGTASNAAQSLCATVSKFGIVVIAVILTKPLDNPHEACRKLDHSCVANRNPRCKAQFPLHQTGEGEEAGVFCEMRLSAQPKSAVFARVAATINTTATTRAFAGPVAAETAAAAGRLNLLMVVLIARLTLLFLCMCMCLKCSGMYCTVCSVA